MKLVVRWRAESDLRGNCVNISLSSQRRRRHFKSEQAIANKRSLVRGEGSGGRGGWGGEWGEGRVGRGVGGGEGGEGSGGREGGEGSGGGEGLRVGLY